MFATELRALCACTSAAFLRLIPSVVLARAVARRRLRRRAPLLLSSSSSLLRYGILLRGVDHAALAAA